MYELPQATVHMSCPSELACLMQKCCVHAVVEGRWWSANFTDGTLLSTLGGGVLQVLLQIDLLLQCLRSYLSDRTAIYGSCVYNYEVFRQDGMYVCQQLLQTLRYCLCSSICIFRQAMHACWAFDLAHCWRLSSNTQYTTTTEL